MPDIIGGVRQIAVKLHLVATALHLKHFVRFCKNACKIVENQIVAKSDIEKRKTMHEQGVIHQHGIQNNVAMIGNKHIMRFGIQVFYAQNAESVGGPLQNPFHHAFHDDGLELFDCLDVAQHFLKLPNIHPEIEIVQNRGQGGIIGYALHGSRNFFIAKRPNIIKKIHNFFFENAKVRFFESINHFIPYL